MTREVYRYTFALEVAPVGRDFNRLILGFLQREFGPDSFRVERVTAPRADQLAARPSEEVCA